MSQRSHSALLPPSDHHLRHTHPSGCAIRATGSDGGCLSMAGSSTRGLQERAIGLCTFGLHSPVRPATLNHAMEVDVGAIDHSLLALVWRLSKCRSLVQLLPHPDLARDGGKVSETSRFPGRFPRLVGPSALLILTKRKYYSNAISPRSLVGPNASKVCRRTSCSLV